MIFWRGRPNKKKNNNSKNNMSDILQIFLANTRMTEKLYR